MDTLKPTGVVDDPTIASLQEKFLEVVVNPILTLVLLITFILFLWGMVRFLTLREVNPEESAKGKKHMLAGLVALFIVASMWGIISTIGYYTESSLWFVKQS